MTTTPNPISPGPSDALAGLAISVQPYRFTADPPAMIRFLETLGLARAITTTDEQFAVLTAAGGSVGVHRANGSQTGATPGQTQLCLSVPSVDDIAGVEGVVTWDESYGRHAGITDPFGGGIWIDEEQTDLYGGYRAHQPSPREGIWVTAVRYSTDVDADKAFFARFGFTAGPDDEWWVPLQAADGSVIGLHKNTGEPITAPAADNPVGENSVCQLGFETTEPLEQLVERLVAAGHPASLEVENRIRAVRVVDPDGQEIQIHSRGL